MLESQSNLDPEGGSLPALSYADTAHKELARPRCLIVLAHPERGLSNTLLQHLQQELGGVELTLRDHGGFDAVWFCGYDASAGGDAAPRLADVRTRHPEAGLLVTGRADETPWERDAFAAGADAVRRWPLSMEELRDEIGRLIQSHGFAKRTARAG